MKRVTDIIENKYTFLIIPMILLLMASPHLEDTRWGILVSGSFYMLISLTAIYTLRERNVNVILFSLLAVTNVILNVVDIQFQSETITLLKLLGFIVFGTIAVIAIYYELSHTTRITTDTILGSVCTYLLIGLTYGAVYTLIEFVHPGSFAHNTTATIEQAMNNFDLNYFSFVTLTTVGFGDIIATTDTARSIVILESITGIFYLATLVSSLITTKR